MLGDERLTVSFASLSRVSGDSARSALPAPWVVAMTAEYDLVVLGAGNAGQAAAGAARAAGWKVAIVEGRDVGGTCPNRGCVPKKVLVAAAEALDVIARASEHHVHVSNVSLDWAKLIEREQALIAELPEAMEDSLRNRGIDVVHGRARFVGQHAVQVGAERLQARKLVVATGSKPRSLRLPGAERLMVSEDFLEMHALPESMVFVGAGVIAMEFAHVLARAGTRVTVLEAAERPLLAFDEDAVQALTEYSRTLGIDLHFGVQVQQIAPRGGGGLQVGFLKDGEPRSIDAAAGLNGTGRIPDVESLDLDAGDIEHEGWRVKLDEHLRSVSNPDVFFAGDAVSGPAQLSPLATHEGRIVGHNLVEPQSPRVPDYLTAPAAVFTIPALAAVGLTEAQAREQGCEFDVKVNEPHLWLTGRSYAERAGYSKVLVEKGSGKILGAHLLGHRAEESIHLLAFAMKYGLSAAGLAENVFAYPTFVNDVKSML